MPEGITPDEGALYQDFLNVLEETRSRIFEGTVSAPSLGPPPLPVPSPAPVAAAPLQMPIHERPADVAPPAAAAPTVTVPPDTPAAEVATIRALSDIPPFVGPDMNQYLLKAGDIAVLPRSIANLLVRRNKAAIIEATL